MSMALAILAIWLVNRGGQAAPVAVIAQSKEP